MIGNETRISIVAITREGALLGGRLLTGLDGARLHVPERFAGEAAAGAAAAGEPGGSGGSGRRIVPVREPAGALLARLFPASRGLVLLFSVGAAVRLLAPLVGDKRSDPAVVAVDDAGRFAVAVLSGHRGGANDLARRVAAILGAQAVITTASDARGLPAVDLLGRAWGWRIEDEAGLTAAAAAVVNGDPVGVYQDAGEVLWDAGGEPPPPHFTVYDTLEDLVRASPAAALVITDRRVEAALAPLAGRSVLYRPRSLVAGVGCNRGTAAEEIVDAITGVLAEHGLSPRSLHHLGTVSAKRDEPGLREAAVRLDCPLRFHEAARLDAAAAAAGLAVSEAVLRSVGARGVAEPAALLGAGGGRLLVPKQKRGNVTVAVARRPCRPGGAEGAGGAGDEGDAGERGSKEAWA